MREILFRGKRIEGGEWVYGLPYAKSRYSIIRSTEILDTNDEEVHMHSLHVVIPETLGQYTGLKDKNGKKIFEGDKVETRAGECAYGVWEYKGTVIVEDIRCIPEDLARADEFEIIGNIHEEVQE